MQKDWKKTLLMPKTNFDMKASLISKEPKFRKWWIENDIYNKALNKNRKNERFVLHDGPPYANGSLHVGHALNKILKDVIVRYKTMRGFYSPYVPGWDTHGLPIENKMLEDLKMSKDDLNKIELRKKAAEYALKQVDIQQLQFEKMQLFSNFNSKYLTLDKNFEVGQLKLFKKMAIDGLIYKGLKPVYWSPSSMSALAEAEVEYQNIRSPQIIVGFDVIDNDKFSISNMELLIMTTTPWTLPANSGVAVGSNIDYSIVKNGNKNFVLASNLVDDVADLAKWENYEIINTLKGKEFIGLKYKQPLSNDECPVVEGHHVTTDSGTGLVHMAPLFGEDDFIIGKNNNLKMIMHVDDDGTLNSEAKEYKNMFYADSSKNIGDLLQAKNKLLSLKFVKHSYPHDWRTHKPVIFRGTPQWFVSIEKIKGQILNELKTIKSYPSWGASRISKMIEGRNDWTISRQRTWGVPIIVFYDEKESPVMIEEVFDHVIQLIKENGSDIWWEKNTDELLPEKYKKRGWTREMDIMDVWFDSGSSSIAMSEVYDSLIGKAPYELYLEGSDQYRGWFNSSLINSVAYTGKAPFKQLISHGFVLDGKFQKMSKSKGNVIDPLKIIEKNGADILRLWAANSEYTSDVTISNDIIKQTSQVYRNIRTKLRFMLGNLFDFDISNHKTLGEKNSYHEWIHVEHHQFMKQALTDMDNYKISKVVKDVSNYVTQLSGWYLDIAKDSLYTDKFDNKERRTYQTNIYNFVQGIILLLAPIIPTTIEEAYKEFEIINKEESVFLHKIDDVYPNKSFWKSENDSLQEKMKLFFELKDRVYKSIENAKQTGLISRANEAIVTIDVNSKFTNKELTKMLMVAAVKKGKSIEIQNSGWEKCERCWNHFNHLNEDNVCKRCSEF